MAAVLDPADLDVAIGGGSLCGPVTVAATVSRITNALTVVMTLQGSLRVQCGRCLREIIRDFQGEARFSYQMDPGTREIDLVPEIREEILAQYPLKPLCDPACKGLCGGCGKNLNTGACACTAQAGHNSMRS